VVQHTLKNSQRMAEDAAQVLEELKTVQSNTNLPLDAWNAFIKGKNTNPTYAKLFTAWQLYVMDSFSLDIGSRDTRIPGGDLLRVNPIFGTLSMIRDRIKTDADLANATIEPYRGAWKREGYNGELPGYPWEAEAIFDAIGQRMNTETGEISGDIPLRLRACCARSSGDHT
jgi:hypothetical protein